MVILKSFVMIIMAIKQELIAVYDGYAMDSNELLKDDSIMSISKKILILK